MINRRHTMLGRRVAVCGLSAVAAGVLLLASCDWICCTDGCDCEPEAFRIYIDSLAFVPPQPTAGDTLHVQFWGTVGTSTCYGFTHFEVTRQPFRVDVTAWGEHSCGFTCGDMMIYLRGEDLALFPLYEGELKIVVHQPGGEVLADSVVVIAAGLGARPN